MSKEKSLVATLFPSYSKNLAESVQKSLDHSYVKADKFMLKLLLGHWAVASTLTAFAYSTYLLGFIGGGLVYGIAWASFKNNPGSVWSRITIGAAFMAFSAIFIQQQMGLIEMHFHIFAALAFFILYKDITPTLSAAVTIALHHAIFNIAQTYEWTIMGTPLMAFNYGCGWGIVALHATFVVLESAVIVMIVINLTNEYLRNTEVFRIMDDLNDSAYYTSQAADFISSSGQELAMDAHQNAEAVVESNKSIDHMNQKIHELNDKTTSVKFQIEDITKNTLGMNKSMEELKESSKNISSITKIIDSIASQTNLLALNAAIEAARAGEAGAGFAVVTEEVRVLAQKTADAATQIGSMIQENIEKAQEGAETSEEISGQIKDLTGFMDEIHVASGDQITELNSIKELISKISSTTDNTASMAERNASTAEELQSQIHVLRTSIEEINRKVAENTNASGDVLVGTQGSNRKVVSASPKATSPHSNTSKTSKVSKDEWNLDEGEAVGLVLDDLSDF